MPESPKAPIPLSEFESTDPTRYSRDGRYFYPFGDDLKPGLRLAGYPYQYFKQKAEAESRQAA